MAKKEKTWPEAVFRHKTEKNTDGEIRYAYPVEVGSKLEGFDEDVLKHFNITKKDCHSIRFTENDVIFVYFLMIKEKDVAKDQWTYLNSKHSREYAHSRCMIPGVRKDYILCPDTRSCKDCPYENNKQKPFISWEKYTSDGNDISTEISTEEEALARIEKEELFKLMISDDKRIADAYRLKTEKGQTAKEIATSLKVSLPRIYQLLSKAEQIIKQYYN